MQRRAPEDDDALGQQLRGGPGQRGVEQPRPRAQPVAPQCGGRFGDDGHARGQAVRRGRAVAGHDDRRDRGAQVERAHPRGVRGHAGPRPAVGTPGRPGGQAGITGRAGRVRVGVLVDQGLAERDVELHRPGVGGAGARGAVEDAADRRPPAVRGAGAFLGQREHDAGPHRGAEQARLVDGLVGARADELERAVGADDDQRHPGVGGLEHRRVQVRDGGPGGDDDGHRAPGAQREPDREEAGRALVDAHVQAHPPHGVGGVHREQQRRVARAGAGDHVTDPAADPLVDDHAGLHRRRGHGARA